MFRIALGGISHESCSFSPLLTTLEDFEIVRGQALYKRYPFLGNYDDVEFLPLLRAKALPGGKVAPEASTQLEEELLDGLRSRGPWNGVYLDMHGSTQVQGMQDYEGHLFARIRQIVGQECLIATSYDLHGNVSRRVIENVDILTAFRTAPHVDEIETCKRACRLLVDCLRSSSKFYTAFVSIPVVLPGERAMTTAKPGALLYGLIPTICKDDRVFDASILIGYCWADEPRVGASVVVIGTDQTTVSNSAVELAKTFWHKRYDFQFGMPTGTVDDCINWAQKAAQTENPVFISDAGDNITGGGVGDVPFMLDRMLQIGVADAVYAGIVDGESVDRCFQAGPGSEVRLSLGGKLDRIHGNSLDVDASVISIHQFERLGQQVVLQIKGIKTIITRERVAFTTVDQFQALGIDLAEQRIVGVKLGYLFPELRKIAKKAFLALSTGAINPVLDEMSYQHIVRPIFPLDRDMDWEPQLIIRVSGGLETH